MRIGVLSTAWLTAALISGCWDQRVFTSMESGAAHAGVGEGPEAGQGGEGNSAQGGAGNAGGTIAGDASSGDAGSGVPSAGAAGSAGSAERDVTFVAAVELNENYQNFELEVPSAVAEGDLLLLFLSLNGVGRTIGEPTGVTEWTLLGEESTSASITRVWHKQAAASNAGATVTVGLSGYNKGALTLAAYRGAALSVRHFESAAETASTMDHVTPNVSVEAGSWLVSYWSEKSAATSSWSPPAGHVVRSFTHGTGAGRMSSLLVDSGEPVVSPSVGGLTASSNDESAQATSWSILIGP